MAKHAQQTADETTHWRDRFRRRPLPEGSRTTGKDGALIPEDRRQNDKLLWDGVSPLATKRSNRLGRIIGPKEDIFKSYLEGGADVIGVSTYPYDGRTVEQLERSIEKLTHAVEKSPHAMLVTSLEDIETAREEGKLGVFLHNQGASGYTPFLKRGGFPGTLVDALQWLPFVPSPKKGDPRDLAGLRDKGLMVTGIAYNIRNYLGAGCMRSEEYGLTALGRNYIRAAKECGMAVDLCHLNEKTTLDAIRYMKDELDMPPLISHVDSYSLRPSHRNASGSDKVLEAVAEAGGVVGVSALAYAIGKPEENNNTIERIIEHIEHFVKKAGPDHVGLGLDYWTGVAPYNPRLLQNLRDWRDNRTGLWDPSEREAESAPPLVKDEAEPDKVMFHPGTDWMAPGLETPKGIHNLADAIRKHFSPENGYDADVADKILGLNMQRVYSKWWEQAKTQQQTEGRTR